MTETLAIRMMEEGDLQWVVELERQLPPLPTDCGCRRGVIGTDVVLVHTGNYLILDVLHISSR